MWVCIFVSLALGSGGLSILLSFWGHPLEPHACRGRTAHSSHCESCHKPLDE